MNKELKYNGYSAQPSDYECQDGELAVAINLVPEDGALKPVLPPKIGKQVSETITSSATAIRSVGMTSQHLTY